MSTAEATSAYRRVRRPKDKEDLIEQLRDEKHGAFKEIRDVIVFAAALGFERNRFEPFEEAARDSIRWETFINRPFSEELVRLIAVAHADAKEVASPDRQADQLEIFEGYANGGLGELESALKASPGESPLDVVLDLLQRSHGESRGVDAIIDLAGGVEL